jgi:mannose-6-phosphate isomerase
VALLVLCYNASVRSPEPVLLRADNFTPPSRTPWGGTRLAREYKRGHIAAGEQLIGESWEVSVEPDFPARLEDGRLLSEYIAAAPGEVLGAEASDARDGTALLVKLIDAREPLSVQIHPADDYPGLVAGECGKPESWYVLDREPGAGLYLGFQRGTVEAEVRAALQEGRSLAPLLRFVPVEPGDFFLIDAGTPHAIGGGLTLVEPQHVMPGRRGVTYRYWDWNRRYDAVGRLDASGAARPLHVEHALRVTAWQRVQEDGFLDSIRLRAGPPDLTAAAGARTLAGGSGLASPWLHVTRVAGTGATRLPSVDRMLAVTVLAGALRIGELRVERGRSAVVPARLAGAVVQLEGAHVLVCAVG